MDAPAVAAVAAGGPALGDAFLPAEADAPVAAATRSDEDFGLIDEDHGKPDMRLWTRDAIAVGAEKKSEPGLRISGPSPALRAGGRPAIDAEPGEARSVRFGGRRYGLCRFDADAAAFEDDLSVAQCEQGVVPAATDVHARQKRRAALPHEDGADGDRLTGISLDAAELRIAVATVSGGALPFFVCHLVGLSILLSLSAGEGAGRHVCIIVSRRFHSIGLW